MAGYFQLKGKGSDQFSFTLKAGNHEVILTSQTYSSKQAALNGIESVRKYAALEARYARKIAKDGSAYFVLVAPNGQVIGKSQMYSGASAMEDGIKSVMANATSIAVKGD